MARQAKPSKTLGRAGTLNAPIAAFTMAILLSSYCISSIRAARREAQSPPSQPGPAQRAGKAPQQQSWVTQALDESRQRGQDGRS